MAARSDDIGISAFALTAYSGQNATQIAWFQKVLIVAYISSISCFSALFLLKQRNL